MLSGPRRTEPPLGAVRRLTVGLLFLGAVTHAGFLAEVVLDTYLSPWHTVPARLAADGQPHREVFRAADGITGAVFVLVCPALFRIAPVHWPGRLTVLVLFEFGVLLLLRAAFPPECLPVEAGLCAAPTERPTELPVLLASVHYVAGPLIVGAWWQGPWKVAMRTLLAVQFALWAALVAADWLFEGWFVGLVARTQVIGGSVLFTLGAVYVLRMGMSRRTRRCQSSPRAERTAPCPG